MDLNEARKALVWITKGNGDRQIAHEQLGQAIDAMTPLARQEGVAINVSVGAKPDWRRMPGKAKKMLQLLDALEMARGPEKLEDRVLARVEQGGGVSMVQLREVTEATEPELRAAIKELRVTYHSDHPQHIVNYSGKYWTAKELSSLGKDLQPTARGTLKVVGKPRQKATNGASTKVSDGTMAEMLTAFEAEVDGHPDAAALCREFARRVAEMFAARENLKKVRHDGRLKEQRMLSNLSEAAEEGIDAGDQTAAAHKCFTMEQAHQAWKEADAERIEYNKEARERKSKADGALQYFAENYRQLDLPGVV